MNKSRNLPCLWLYIGLAGYSRSPSLSPFAHPSSRADLQADPTLGPARLQLLIDSLAAGVDVFADAPDSAASPGAARVDEVGVILNDDSVN